MPALAQIPVRNVRAQTIKPVTRRQIEVIKLLSDGLSHKEIAAQRGVSISTVRNLITEAGLRVPGAGSPSVRLVYWYRGATAELLEGE
jgi:DNA-binding CsgD family transcriptional regulator